MPKQKTITIQLTDLQFHTTKARKPVSLFRRAFAVLRNRLPGGRAYSNDFSVAKDGTIAAEMFIPKAELDRLRQDGTQVVVEFAPNFKVDLGPDAKEYLAAQERKATERL